MKTIRLALIINCLLTITVGLAAEKPKTNHLSNPAMRHFEKQVTPPAPAPQKSYLDGVSVSPYGAVVHHNITDGQSWGTGVDLGLGINKFVSVHALATAYSDNGWRGSAVDELGIYGKARLVRNAGETLSLYGLAGGDRDFNSSDWAVGVGLGIDLRISKNVGLFADSRVRAWFREGRTEDLQTRAGLQFSF